MNKYEVRVTQTHVDYYHIEAKDKDEATALIRQHVIEDDCFIGARSEVVEGCIVRKGAVIGMGVFIGKSTKIYNRETGETTYGEIPPYSVVVSGSIPSKGGVNLYCAVIVKQVDEKTRSKTSINDLLRD